MRQGLHLVAVSGLALLVTACGSKGAVSLVSHVENPELAVQSVALGTGISGGFDLVFELGEYAEENETVSLGSFGVVTSSDEEIVPTLSLSVESGPPLPVTIGPGKSVSVRLVHAGADTLDASVADQLCAGPVAYRGGVTSNGKSIGVRSLDFDASCP